MECPVCHFIFDEDKRSPACPHPAIERPIMPQGGPRLLSDIQAVIDDAAGREDIELLRRYLDHPNILARIYASRKFSALRALLGARS